MSQHLNSAQLEELLLAKQAGRSDIQCAEYFHTTRQAIHLWVQKFRKAGHIIPSAHSPNNPTKLPPLPATKQK